MNRYVVLMILLMASGFAEATERSGQWRSNLHDLSENGGDKSQVLTLLGQSSAKRQVVVADPASYINHGPTRCFDVVKGQRLEAWFYPVGDVGYWVILDGQSLQCIAFEPFTAPLFGARP
ncbi:MAG: hypothetical protein EON58_08830 [Alphaproteobacteria bacterium]|nr:MAG: hypothetical protein EON58_08830 [Alphaproteobacteria bacterium]